MLDTLGTTPTLPQTSFMPNNLNIFKAQSITATTTTTTTVSTTSSKLITTSAILSSRVSNIIVKVFISIEIYISSC